MPAPVGDDIRSNIDSIFKYYTQKNAQKNPGDKAMKANYGGIDLASAARRLQTQGNGTINFHIDPALLRQLQDAPGFVPVIINIKPMNDLKEFLGAPPKVPPKVPGHWEWPGTFGRYLLLYFRTAIDGSEMPLPFSSPVVYLFPNHSAWFGNFYIRMGLLWFGKFD